MAFKQNKSLLFLFLFLGQNLFGQQSDKFVLIPAGMYEIGKEGNSQNPTRKVHIDSFRMAIFETTNQQFEIFVAATHYVTDAEKFHNAMVFQPGLDEFKWLSDSTASWRYPNGITRGGINKIMNHPVTCISYHDAEAYCAWAGVRLPTIEEWEIACRAGTRTDYFFGTNDRSIKSYANIWYGRDHKSADLSDGFMYTSPVGKFKPNPWGLYDMYGNVFEFCSGKISPSEKSTLIHARGGSWWCSKNSCHSFNSYSIGQAYIHASFSNQGFRVVAAK
ncbi:MAG: sulfatase-modifying factor protein [Bacteroidetes bacterium]|nr:MAG: sulfatase-modifying factor protein [Bacteroidota bacterium]